MHPPFYRVPKTKRDVLKIYLSKNFYLGEKICAEFKDGEIVLQNTEKCEPPSRILNVTYDHKKRWVSYLVWIPTEYAHLYTKYDYEYITKQGDEVHIYFFSEDEIVNYLNKRNYKPKIDESIFMKECSLSSELYATAVNIPVDIFKKILSLSKKYNIPRSRVVVCILREVFSDK